MKLLNERNYFSATEAAAIIGVSRVTIFNWIKRGLIGAEKVGRNYIISQEELAKHVDKRPINEEEKKEIKNLLDRAIKDYGETIRRLGKE